MQHDQYDQRGGGYPPGYPPQQPPPQYPPPQYPGYPQQPYPPQYQPQYPPPGYGYKKPMEPPEFAWLWMAIGIFFFVSFFIPFSSDPMFFIWDCPGVMIFLFATAMMMGIGTPIVAYVVPKFIRMIVLLSMGAFGLLSFTIFQGQRAGAGGTFLALSSFAFVGAYIANESRLKYPYNFLSRLLGGICGGALALFVILGELLQITQTGYFTGMNAMRVISFILMLLASLTLAGSGVILLVNLAVRPDSSKLAKMSRLLLQIGMLVLLGWPLIGEPVSMLIDFSFAAGLWTFFFVLRISGFVLGYMILLGFWLYKLLDMVSFQKFPGQPPVYPQYPPAGAGQPPGYGPQGGYGPPQGGYGPPQGGYGPPQGGYGPPQGGYGPPQGGYGPPQGGYGPPQGGYGPPQGGYGPPQGGGWPPPGGGQPPPGQ